MKLFNNVNNRNPADIFHSSDFLCISMIVGFGSVIPELSARLKCFFSKCLKRFANCPFKSLIQILKCSTHSCKSIISREKEEPPQSFILKSDYFLEMTSGNMHIIHFSSDLGVPDACALFAHTFARDSVLPGCETPEFLSESIADKITTLYPVYQVSNYTFAIDNGQLKRHIFTTEHQMPSISPRVKVLRTDVIDIGIEEFTMRFGRWKLRSDREGHLEWMAGSIFDLELGYVKFTDIFLRIEKIFQMKLKISKAHTIQETKGFEIKAMMDFYEMIALFWFRSVYCFDQILWLSACQWRNLSHIFVHLETNNCGERNDFAEVFFSR